MKATVALALGIALGLSACGKETVIGDVEEQDSAERQQAREAHRAEILAELRRRHDNNWIEHYGSVICDGHMTRRKDLDFCTTGVPEDWRPFLFNGRIYYVQPLAQNQRQPSTHLR